MVVNAIVPCGFLLTTSTSGFSAPIFLCSCVQAGSVCVVTLWSERVPLWCLFSNTSSTFSGTLDTLFALFEGL